MLEQQAHNAGDVGAAPVAATLPTATTTTTAAAPAAPITVQNEKKAATVEDVADDDDVPDPDEDDLDDLDDMLEEFNAVKLDSKPPAAAAGPILGPERPPGGAAPTGDDLPLDEDEFARQLQAGMADLLGEIESSPEMQAQFESIFKELGAAASAASATSPDPKSPLSAPTPPIPSSTAPPPSTTTTTGAEASFQETIRRTMERMQTSGEQATAAAAAEGSDDFLAELLKQMQAGGGDLGGEGSEEEFSKMLLGMMEQLTNKEILYEPMKELHVKFPDWLDKNRATTSPEDLKRYEEQQGLVAEIVAKFEEAGYSDEKAADREYIVDRMQKMQASGQPPADLVGDMPSTQDALAMPDEGCAPQ
ncbi:Pex19 protein family-domain-containing protein [Triangularia verruculosa]|uniref:Pex19 protein family-domain-containing protein n=1 Tax=Triangularia verruculosa TaxID=2587418 RepID=A0AAN6XF42_9PEZI|nr:Pex19 protein family-domain-containing protein [Triangularia verruculosa]